jgi:uncharacterized delta-60 repeat protein
MINRNSIKLLTGGGRNLFCLVQLFALLVLLGGNPARAVAPDYYDVRFGTTNGTVFAAFAQKTDGRAVAIAPDGKIVVVGDAQVSAGATNIAVAKFTVHGTPDTTFGNGGGAVYGIASDSGARAVAIQPDGKIVVAGFVTESGKKSFVVLRLLADGNFDSSFGTNSAVKTAVGSGDDEIKSLALQPDGKIVAAGFSTSGGIAHYAAARYSSSGVLDAGFSTDGKVVTAVGTTDEANAVAVQPDGKIILAGKSLINGKYDFSLVRYKTDGSLDSTFNASSNVTTSIRANNDEVRALAIQDDGKIVVAGSSEDSDSTGDFALARYNANGTLDNSFSSDGRLVTDVGTDSYAAGVAIQKDGKILVAGADDPGVSAVRAALARYLPNGTTDSQFGANGIGYYALPQLSDNYVNALALQPNGRIVVAGKAVNGTDVKQFVTRLRGNAAPTADFDGDYKSDYSVFRPSAGAWYILGSKTSQFSAVPFGTIGDTPAPGDFDGDGRTDVSVFRPSDGTWYRLNSRDNQFVAFRFGQAGDVPMPADYDGDGYTDYAVYRPAENFWYVLRSKTGALNAKHFGMAGDIPVKGDFDDNGADNVAVFRPSNGTWYYSNAGDETISAVQFGMAGDIPAPANYDSASRTNIAVFRPSNGNWYRLSNSQLVAVQFGTNGDVPVLADYDRDGRDDIAVWRPSDGTYYFLQSSDNAFRAAQWGTSGDAPVAGF